MAIIIENKSICPICEKLIMMGDHIVGFPPLALNDKDALYFFSDRGFHEACFIAHPLREEVLKKLRERDEDI